MLAIGNDGMRFRLDDMSLTVNSATYSSDAVKSAIQAGNTSYTTSSVGEWTESEMDEIFATANSSGIEIIPQLNSLGHMDAVLYAASSLTGATCSYNSSIRTIDVTNTTAVILPRHLSRSTSITSQARAAGASTSVPVNMPMTDIPAAAWALVTSRAAKSTATLSSTSMSLPPWSEMQVDTHCIQ